MRILSPGISSLLLSLLLTVLVPLVSIADEVVIGAILPLSGTHAAVGHMQKNSMLMAVEEINARGGINGQALKLDIRDSGGRVKNALAVVDHFARDKQYPAVLGGLNSRIAAVIAERCEVRNLPLVLITGSEDSITLQGYHYVFRVAPPVSKYPQAALDYARSVVDPGRVALITEKSSYGDAMSRTVKRAAGEAGWSVSGDWKFDIGDRNLQWLYAEAQSVKPDAIFLAVFSPEASQMVPDLREWIPKAALFNLTPASILSGSYAQCGSSCEGVMNPSLWFPEAEPAALRYRERYRDRFRSEPDYHGAQAYASVVVTAQAMKKSGVNLAEPVRAALEEISAATPYGRVSFRQWDGFGNQNDPAHYLLRWTGKEFELVWPRN